MRRSIFSSFPLSHFSKSLRNFSLFSLPLSFLLLALSAAYPVGLAPTVVPPPGDQALCIS